MGFSFSARQSMTLQDGIESLTQQSVLFAIVLLSLILQFSALFSSLSLFMFSFSRISFIETTRLKYLCTVCKASSLSLSFVAPIHSRKIRTRYPKKKASIKLDRTQLFSVTPAKYNWQSPDPYSNNQLCRFVCRKARVPMFRDCYA